MIINVDRINEDVEVAIEEVTEAWKNASRVRNIASPIVGVAKSEFDALKVAGKIAKRMANEMATYYNPYDIVAFYKKAHCKTVNTEIDLYVQHVGHPAVDCDLIISIIDSNVNSMVSYTIDCVIEDIHHE